MEKDQDIADLEIRTIGLTESALQDLKLPKDALIISIHRGRDLLVHHDHLQIREGDVLTLAGPEKTLDDLAVRFEGLARIYDEF